MFGTRQWAGIQRLGSLPSRGLPFFELGFRLQPIVHLAAGTAITGAIYFIRALTDLVFGGLQLLSNDRLLFGLFFLRHFGLLLVFDVIPYVERRFANKNFRALISTRSYEF